VWLEIASLFLIPAVEGEEMDCRMVTIRGRKRVSSLLGDMVMLIMSWDIAIQSLLR